MCSYPSLLACNLLSFKFLFWWQTDIIEWCDTMKAKSFLSQWLWTCPPSWREGIVMIFHLEIIWNFAVSWVYKLYNTLITFRNVFNWETTLQWPTTKGFQVQGNNIFKNFCFSLTYSPPPPTKKKKRQRQKEHLTILTSGNKSFEMFLFYRNKTLGLLEKSSLQFPVLH